MSRLLYRTGLPLAFCAAMILTLPACAGPEEVWKPDTLVENTPLEGPHFAESTTAGKLDLVATQKVKSRRTPVERKTLVYTDSWIDFDWDNFGVAVFSIVGGILSIGLYFVLGYFVYNKNKNDKKN